MVTGASPALSRLPPCPLWREGNTPHTHTQPLLAGAPPPRRQGAGQGLLAGRLGGKVDKTRSLWPPQLCWLLLALPGP